MTLWRAFPLAAALVLASLQTTAGASEPADGSPSAIETAARDAARNRIAPPDRYEPESCRVEGGDSVTADTPLEVLEIVGPDPSGTVKIKFRTLPPAGPRGEVRATVHGRVRGPVLVARQVLIGGAPIDAAAIENAEADLTRLGQPPLRDARQAVGLVPLRTIGAGRVLTASLLAAPPTVHRGDALDLRFERGRLRVRTIGIAREDGATGDLVTALNTATGASVIARVQPDGSLLVLRASDAGRSRR